MNEDDNNNKVLGRKSYLANVVSILRGGATNAIRSVHRQVCNPVSISGYIVRLVCISWKLDTDSCNGQSARFRLGYYILKLFQMIDLELNFSVKFFYGIVSIIAIYDEIS